MCSVEIDGFDLWQSGNMILFCVEGCALVGGGGGVRYSNGVLYQPFIDGLCGMSHEHSALEVGLCEDIGECCCVVQMETVAWLRLAWARSGRETWLAFLEREEKDDESFRHVASKSGEASNGLKRIVLVD